MADYNRQAATLDSPLRLARKPQLNTIFEAIEPSPDGPNQKSNKSSRESLHSIKIAMSFSPETAKRLSTPVSSHSTSSSCSDDEWQRGLETFDSLYDVTDDESCPSLTESRPSSLMAPSIRSSTYSTNSRNRYPSITIPASALWPSVTNPHKSSPVPPTPPPKIPVSPAALSLLPGHVPALHAPPSLDGSMSSDQISNLSAPATPDLRPLPDADWEDGVIRVCNDSDVPSSAGGSSTGLAAEEERAIEASSEDWNPLLNRFPDIPSRPEGRLPTADTQPHIDNTTQPPSPDLDGVMLPPDALATLEHIPLGGTPEPWSETSETNDEIWQLSAQDPSQRREGTTPHSELSGYSFTGLSIPSPGGFFSSLDPRSRHTWSLPSATNPPTSAVAARFYDLPWGRDGGQIVEQIVELPEEGWTDDQPTAVPVTAVRISNSNHGRSASFDSKSPVQELNRTEVAYEYDEAYDEELKRQAVSNLDRTSVWLAAQQAYLSALSVSNPVNETNKETVTPDAEKRPVSSSTDSPPRKCVRFSEVVQESAASSTPPARANMDSIYWQGFQFILRQCCSSDIFLHSNIRFDAVQSVRLGLRDKHIDALTGKFELVKPERPGYKGPFSQSPRKSVAAGILADQAMFGKVEKEQMVLAQLWQSMWAIDAMRFLNGGSLLSSPAAKRLSMATLPLKASRNTGKRRLRVLDFGGQATCGWAWHLANDFPNVKIYTVVRKDQEVNSHIKGPENHRRVSVPYLWKLPFRDNQFDVISARSLHALLKTQRPDGEQMDEYDLCLQECYRCLKPGGYLEFFMIDSEIARAGPNGSAASVEFSFNLKTRGYDPTPTRTFLTRLKKNNFADVKRAWLFLPMGVEPTPAEPMRETPNPRVKSQIDCEAVQGPIGSTGDIASMTGLLGGWMWEQWLLKLQVEMGRERSDLLKGVGNVFDEGRKNSSGWTSLCGWAMKPKRRSSVQSLQL